MGKSRMLLRIAKRTGSPALGILWTELVSFLLVDHIFRENFHIFHQHLKSEGRPPSSCPWGQPSASSLKSGQLDCWTMCHYMACCHIFRCYYNICNACRLFCCLCTWSHLSEYFWINYLINQADVGDGKQKKEEGGNNQRPEKVSIHPPKNGHCLILKAPCLSSGQLKRWYRLIRFFFLIPIGLLLFLSIELSEELSNWTTT